MKIILLVLCFFLLSCNSTEKTLKLDWKKSYFKEAGFKAEFPCKPKKDFNSFQDEPRPIHTYSFDCDSEGIKFYISSKHYMDEFNEDSISNFFKSIESGNKEFYGELKETKRENIDDVANTKGKIYKLEGENGKILYHTALANRERLFSIITVLSDVKKSNKQIDEEFNEISKKFRDSFEIIKE